MKTFSTPMCFTVLCSKSVILTVNQCWERVEISFCVKRKSLIIQKNIKYNKEIKKGKPFRISLCGERGIRTPETLLTFTRFPGVPLQPLEHLSIADKQSNVDTIKGYAHVLCSNSCANLRCFF